MSHITDLREIACYLAGMLDADRRTADPDVLKRWHPHGFIRGTIYRALERIAARPDPHCPEGDPCARWGQWHRVCNVLNHELRQVSAKLEEEFSGYHDPLPLGDWSWYGFMHVAGVDWERIDAEAAAERRAARGTE